MRNKARRWLRLAAYTLCVSLVLGTLATRSAFGDLQDSAMVVGRQLSQFEDMPGRSYRVRLNGEPIQVASAVTDQSVAAVLDRFEKMCEENAGAMKTVFEQLPEPMRRDVAAKVKGNGALAIVRNGVEREGYVACLAQAPGEDITTLGSRLESFAATGDLSKVGDLRYVYARRRPKGTKTHVVTVWTDGSFHPGRVLPAEGAEPAGTDPANAPRPLDSVRLLAAEVEGAPYAVRIYDSRASEKDVLAAYDASMPGRGWSPIPHVAREVAYARAYSRDGVDMLVFAFADGDRCQVSLVESVSGPLVRERIEHRSE